MKKLYTDYSEAYNIYSNTHEPFTETLNYYDTSADSDATLLNNYNAVTSARKQLDNDLQELYTDNSRYQIYQSKADAATFAGILWVVLATTLIYLVFTKL